MFNWNPNLGIGWVNVAVIVGSTGLVAATAINIYMCWLLWTLPK